MLVEACSAADWQSVFEKLRDIIGSASVEFQEYIGVEILPGNCGLSILPPRPLNATLIPSSDDDDETIREEKTSGLDSTKAH